jgi:P27 family predicted phage terminase small subunit
MGLATAGRKRQPTPSILLKGTQKSDRINKAEPVRTGKLPKKPEGLSPIAAKAWDDVIEILIDMRVLDKADGTTVELLCQARADWMEARRAIELDGPYYDSGDGTKKILRPHPMLGVRSDASKRMLTLLAELGMTPASRSKVSAAPSDEPDDPAEAYFQ